MSPKNSPCIGLGVSTSGGVIWWGLHLGRGVILTQGQTQSPTGVRSSGNLRWCCCWMDVAGQMIGVIKIPFLNGQKHVFFLNPYKLGKWGYFIQLTMVEFITSWKKLVLGGFGTQWRVSVVKKHGDCVRPQVFVHNPFHSWPKFMAKKGGPELPSPTTGPTSEPNRFCSYSIYFIDNDLGGGCRAKHRGGRENR